MQRPRLQPIGLDRDAGDIVDLALTGVGVVGALVAVLAGNGWVAIAAAVPSALAEVVRGRRPPRLRRMARRILLDRAGRSLVRNGAVLVAVATIAQAVSFADVAVVLVGAMVVHLALSLYMSFAQRAIARDGARITWQHLDVRGVPDGPGEFPDAVATRFRIEGLRVLALTEFLLLAGDVCITLELPGGPATPVGITILLAVLVAGIAFSAWGPRGLAPRNTDDAVVEALERYAPEVAFYFSSPASGTYALTVWADVINAMRRPTVVIVREPIHLESLGRIRVPIVVAAQVADLERVALPCIRVVLYPTNVVRNNEMVRIPGPLHCFIGHGDSDKVGSFSPLNRMYDEIWVAGEAAVDRYRAVDEGIDIGKVLAVGRPQLAEIHRADPAAHADGRLTVLYAPTWEGFFDEADYSSVARMGEALVAAALDSGARVRFKPHPLTGHRLKAAGAAREAIATAVTRAGGGSGVVPNTPDALYAAFNEADVLVTDISSVITDFLASRKPYVVANPRNTPLPTFVEIFPSAAAATIVPPSLDGFREALAAAAGDDVLRPAREALAKRLLGDEPDPLEAFLRHVDGFIARADARVGAPS